MQHTDRDRAIALAGIFQATQLVQQIARTGMVDQACMETCIRSVFNIDAENVDAVFGNAANLKLGYKAIMDQLGGKKSDDGKPRDIEVTKYVINVMILERKLAKRRDMLGKIGTDIEMTKSQLEHFGLTHDNIIARLAHIYSETISKVKPRILVNGEHQHISNPNNANKVRALLLAAIRAAVLWRQCGGNRWLLLFRRNVITNETEKLLHEV